MSATTDHRGSARARGYDNRWDSARSAFLAKHPICLGCEAIGRTVKATVVDHVEPHRGDHKKFWGSFQPACRWHHDVIKPRLERMVEQGELTLVDLWLNSKAAIAMSKRYPAQQDIGVDGWPVS